MALLKYNNIHYKGYNLKKKNGTKLSYPCAHRVQIFCKQKYVFTTVTRNKTFLTQWKTKMCNINCNTNKAVLINIYLVTLRNKNIII